MAASDMPTPGTVVHRETIEALKDLRRTIKRKASSGASTPSWSDADVAAIRKIARRHQQCTDRLHRIWEGESKAKFEHTRDVYLSAFPTRACATVRAFAKTRRRATVQDIYQFAKQLDVGEPQWETVRVKLEAKPKGGYRAITKYGPRRMAQQFIVRDLLTAVGLDNEYDYCRRGAGGEKALIRDACERIEDRYWHWQIVDVVKCFASLKPAHLDWLPLPKELVRNVVFLPKCAKMEVVKKTDTSGGTLYSPSLSLTTKTVRRGLPQGSVLSPLVARAFLGREIRAALGKKQVATFWFVDDLTLGARSRPEVEHALNALRERLQGHPAGPILLHVYPPTSVEHGRVKVFGYNLEPGRGYGDNPVHVFPRAVRPLPQEALGPLEGFRSTADREGVGRLHTQKAGSLDAEPTSMDRRPLVEQARRARLCFHLRLREGRGGIQEAAGPEGMSNLVCLPERTSRSCPTGMSSCVSR